LRLEGSWLAGRDQAVPGIELNLSRDDESIVLDPLPDPANFPVAATPSGMPWRAAFPASIGDARDESSRFVMSLSDGSTFYLPAPRDRDAEPEPPAPELA